MIRDTLCGRTYPQQYPVIVDEVGAYDGYPVSLTWNQGFMDYLTTWVLTQHGAGVIAFNGYWSDANSMYDANDQWTQWGAIFVNSPLQKVP